MNEENRGLLPPVQRRPVDRSRLKRHQYLLSLFEEGARTGLMQQNEISRCQTSLIVILQSLIRRFTQEASSSVTVEAAEGMMASVLYAVDAQLASFEEPEEAVKALQTVPMREIYQSGVGKVGQCLEEVKQLYREVCRMKLDVGVESYELTIDESVPVFIKKYGILFDAHNTMASIDYPLAIDDMRIQGIYYLRQYLRHLLLETRFCRLFDQAELGALLHDFGEVCRFDYRIELFNIFEVALHNAVGAIMSGGRAGSLRLEEAQVERLRGKLAAQKPEQVGALVQPAVRTLLAELNIVDEHLKTYVKQCGSAFVQRLSHAAANGNLQAVIITRQLRENMVSELSFSLEDRMEDRAMRALLEQARGFEYESPAAKIALLRSRLRSLHDYLDVLDSDILYGEDYMQFYSSLGDAELAILAKIVFYEQLRYKEADLITIAEGELESCGDDDSWRKYFAVFIGRMERERAQIIAYLCTRIHYEAVNFY